MFILENTEYQSLHCQSSGQADLGRAVADQLGMALGRGSWTVQEASVRRAGSCTAPSQDRVCREGPSQPSYPGISHSQPSSPEIPAPPVSRAKPSCHLVLALCHHSLLPGLGGVLLSPVHLKELCLLKSF